MTGEYNKIRKTIEFLLLQVLFGNFKQERKFI